MRDRIVAIGPIAAVAGVLGICCGLPVLRSIEMVDDCTTDATTRGTNP